MIGFLAGRFLSHGGSGCLLQEYHWVVLSGKHYAEQAVFSFISVSCMQDSFKKKKRSGKTLKVLPVMIHAKIRGVSKYIIFMVSVIEIYKCILKQVMVIFN